MWLSKLNNEKRFDSEYFKKENLLLFNILNKHHCLKIEETAYVTDGIHTSIDYCESSGVNLISATSPRENFFDLSRQVFISESAHKTNPRTALKLGDVVISTVGTIGNCAVVDNSVLPANSDRHVGIIRIEKNFSSYYVSTFLLSKFGRFQTLRESTGNVQLNLFIYKIKELVIPHVSTAFQNMVENTVKFAHNKLERSKTTYIQAETLLLSTLSLTNFAPSTEKVNIKSFKNSFTKTGRLDAEYYQKKYEDYQKHVISYRNGWKPLNKICNLQDFNYTPNNEKEYKYVELADIGNSGTIESCTLELGKELPSRARRKVQTGNVLISSIEGSLSSCAIVTEAFNNALCSTGFYVLNSEQINSETLLVLFKCSLMQNILKQNCSGTILTAINKVDFDNIPLPIIDINIQTQISSFIQKSFKLKFESEQLLETAKRAVEIAIEQNEEEAIKFLSYDFKNAENDRC